MNFIQEEIQPKFKELSDSIIPFLNGLSNDVFYSHIAKHARRTVNPPKDTWVAFATNKRGYKMLPHFQIGLWDTHLFIWFAVIYESPMKQKIAKQFKDHQEELYKSLPVHFDISYDHMKPTVIQKEQLSLEEFSFGFERLHDVKKTEFLCGVTIQKEKAICYSKDQLIQLIKETYNTVYPFYQTSCNLVNL
jgi:uncharacterized protein YktB (UPF0637 family)